MRPQGQTRPIRILAFEAKLVQRALREVLEAIDEQDFSDCSCGFRPGRSTHATMRALDRSVGWGEVSWILEADIMSLFDSVVRTALVERLQTRVADRSLLRLIGKCLHLGVLDGEVLKQHPLPQPRPSSGDSSVWPDESPRSGRLNGKILRC